MVILPFGVKQPTTGDRGSVFFPALEQLCQKFSSHTHNGVNSALIAGAYISAGAASAPSANWSLVSDGLYSQEVDLPAGYLYDNCAIQVRDSVTKEMIYPTIEKVSNTRIKIYACMNTLSYEVVAK